MIKTFLIPSALTLALCLAPASGYAQGNSEAATLTNKQRAMIPIAAFTATGQLDRLADSLEAGLDAGLSVSEIKEILVHLYAYSGFPRSLNGLVTFRNVLEARRDKGINDAPGRDATPLPAGADLFALGKKNQETLVGGPYTSSLMAFAPAIDQFLKEHLFGAIFARDVLSFEDREVVTLAALAAMGVEPQLRGHFRASRNVGLTKAKHEDFITVLANTVDPQVADKATQVLARAIAQ